MSFRRAPGAGRPALDPAVRRSVKVSVALTTGRYDALYARASGARLSLSEFIRRAVDDYRPPKIQR